MSDFLKEGFIDQVKGSLNRGGGSGGSGQINVIEKIKVNGVDQSVDKYKAVNIPVPTKTSELENDEGFLKEHQDLSEYAKSKDIPTKTSELVNDSGYAKESDIPTVPSNISSFTNDKQYQTADDVTGTLEPYAKSADVTKQITDEVAKIVANAPEDFDTLKEMSDWIANHENDASAMNSAIQANKTDIAGLCADKADLSDLDELGVRVTTVEGEVDGVNRNLHDLSYGESAGGKNLFDKNNVEIGNYDTNDGYTKIDDSTGRRLIDFISVKPSTRYTMSGNSANVRMFEYGQNKNLISSVVSLHDFTTGANTHYIKFQGAPLGNEGGAIQFEEGTKATDYEPYIMSNKQLTSVNASLGDYNIDNKFDGVFTQGGFDSSGKFTNSTSTLHNTNKIRISEGDLASIYFTEKSYTRFCFFDSSNNFISTVTSSGKVSELKEIAPANASYFIFNVGRDYEITPSSVPDVRVYVNSDIDEIKKDLSEQESSVDQLYLNALPVGSIVQIEQYFDTLQESDAKDKWLYLGTSSIQYDNGAAVNCITNVYRKLAM